MERFFREIFQGYFTWVRITVVTLHQSSPLVTWWSRLGSLVVGGSSGHWKKQDVGCGTCSAECSAPSLASLQEFPVAERETWDFILIDFLEILLELLDWNVYFWCSLFLLVPARCI